MTALGGRYIGKNGAFWVTIYSTILAFIIALYGFLEILENNTFIVDLGSWISIYKFHTSFLFVFDSLSITMSLLILFISGLVQLYSRDYMGHDPHFIRFMSFLSFFAFTMLLLVTSGNYLQMFVGWEGVGLASYCLINFWHTRNEANKGALKAIIVNRIGDIAFLIALTFLFIFWGSSDFSIVFSLSPLLKDIKFFSYNIVTLVSFFLTFAAFAKSAQLLLHVWLPDAMEGPTPVSSLLHSATMVTAGIFLIIRSSPLFNFSPNILKIIALFGIFTAFFSSIIGLTQYDIKRIIAYSTCSQLGFMMFACGISANTVAFYHLVNHAFFKCVLFLCSGVIIHALGDEQDIRKMGGLINFFPLTYPVMLIASLSLAGFPFTSGFYSKDAIIESTYAQFSEYAFSITIVALLTSFFTAFYSTRLLYLVFFGETRISKQQLGLIEEAPKNMAIPLVILALLSIISGFFLKALFLQSPFWRFSIVNKVVDSEFIPFFVKLSPTIAAFAGIFVSLFLYRNNKLLYSFKIRFYDLYILSSKKFFFDSLYNHYIFVPLAKSCTFIFEKVDRGILELFGPHGIFSLVSILATRIRKMQSGYVWDYIKKFLYFFFLFIGLTVVYQVMINII